MACIAILNDKDKLLQRAVAHLGSLEILSQANELNSRRDQLVLINCTHSGLEVLLSLADDLPRDLPVVAVMNKNQAIPKGLSRSHIQDLATVEELGSAAFQWRVQQLVSQYQKPLSTEKAITPELNMMQSIANHVDDWVIVKDLEHRFVFVCSSFINAVGLSRDQIIGRNDLQIGTDPIDVYGDPDTDWIGFWAQDDAAVEGGVTVIEENLNWRTFVINRRYKRTVRTPLRNSQGKVFALLVAVSDITDRVLAERNLQARNLMLRRVTKEKQNAEQQRQIAEQAVSAKNKFLAAASHDLRQPLHALGLFLTVLENRLSKPSDLEILNKVKLSKDALNALFNSLLDISRLDAGIIEVNEQTFPISNLLVSVRDEYTQLGLDKGLSVNIDICQNTVHTDSVLLGRIVRNLIQNAITHTCSGSVNVTFKQSAEHLHLTVADTGPGIPESEQQAVFNEYYQLGNDGDGAAHGLGLGLAIVNRMASLLGIEVTLQSELGCGSCFTVSIPKGCTPYKPSDAEPDRPAQFSGTQVLLIEDDPKIREGLRMILAPIGCDCIDAACASSALKSAIQNDFEPDVMVVDYQLKNGLTGDAAIQKIRQHYQRLIPAIIVTGDTSKVRLQDAKRCGSRLLHKPMEASTLIKALSEVLEESSVEG